VTTIGELAKRYGVAVADLVKAPLYGALAPDAPFSARFRWDPLHEPPVTSAEDLARREVLATPPPTFDALELAARYGADPVARTVDVHMQTWHLQLGDHVATLAHPPNGPTTSVPAGRTARLTPGDRVYAPRPAP